MPGSSLLSLIDDIASLLDDVSIMSKLAVKKTAGVLGDDLALNAEQVTGVNAEREIPVVWAVAKGALLNKVILVPAALLISAVLPWAVMPLLMIGGLFLCYEGFHKLVEKFCPHPEAKVEHNKLLVAMADPQIDLVAFEKEKIKGAIRTDFILSAEIVVIALGSVSHEPFLQRLIVLCIVSLIVTFGVYGIVGGIVKLDDLGFYLQRRGKTSQAVGRAILKLAPLLMKCIGVLGTVAMFMVGGGIVAHGFSFVGHGIDGISEHLKSIPTVGSLLGSLSATLLHALVGILSGAIVLGMVTLGTRLLPKKRLP